MEAKKENGMRPGACVTWEEKKKELPEITGDEKLVKKAWEEVDSLPYTFIWQMVVSF